MVKRGILAFLIGIMFVLMCADVSAFVWVGWVKNSTGSYVGGANVSVKTVEQPDFETIVSINSTSTNAAGYFALAVDEDTNRGYQPIIKVYDENGDVLEVGPTLPDFPLQEYGELNGSTITTQESVALNISTYMGNSADNITPRGGVIFDAKLGFVVATFQNNNASNNKSVYIHMPASRNYSVILWRTDVPPKTFNINNISLYSSPKVIHFKENMSVTFSTVYGHAICTENASPLNFSAFYMYDYMNQQVQLGTNYWRSWPNDFFNSTGNFNVSVPGPNTPMLLALYANDSNGNYFAGFKNLSVTGDTNVNITLRKLAGAYRGDNTQVNTSRVTIILTDSAGAAVNNAFAEITTIYDGMTIKWSQSSGAANTLNLSLWNSTTATIQVFSSSYAPRKYRASLAALNAQNSTITIPLYSMNITDDEGEKLDMNMIFYKSNSTCDVASPPAGCLFNNFTSDKEFSPMQAMLGGSVSLRFVQGNGVVIHYANVDLLASGPPDIMLEDAPANTTSGSALESAWKFGSKGPDMYDFILIGVPYSETATDESGAINISIPILYDEDFNVIWNISTDGVNVNLSDYANYDSAWFTAAGIKCTAAANLSNSQNCSLDTTKNMLWLRLPHFSAVGPTVKGTAKAAAAAAASTTSSSSSGSSGSMTGSISSNPSSTYIFDNIAPDSPETMSINKEGLPVTKMEFILNKEVTDAEVTMEAVGESEIEVGKLDTPVYQYLSIKKVSIADSDVKGVTVNFKVLKQWLTDNNIAKENVYLMIYNGNSWEKAASTTLEQSSSITGAVIGASGGSSIRKIWEWICYPFKWLKGSITGYAVYAPSDYEYYVSKMGYLSKMAITGDTTVIQSEPEAKAAEETEEAQPEQQPMEEQPAKKFNWALLASLIVIVAAIALVTMFVMRRKKSRLEI